MVIFQQPAFMFGGSQYETATSSSNNLIGIDESDLYDNETVFTGGYNSIATLAQPTLLVGSDDEPPTMGLLGFCVVTFGTATCIFCVLANTIVLLDIRRDILSTTSISHRTHQLFHITQTMIDFLLGILIMPIHVLLDSHMAGDWLFNTPLCRVWYAFDVALCTAAIWNQYISCLDKYWCVTSPTTYVGKKRRSRIKQMFRILGLLAFGIGSPVLFDCNLADNAIYAFYSTLASFWVPMITLLTLSFRSYRFRRELVKFNRKANVFISPVLLAQGFFSVLNSARRRKSETASTAPVLGGVTESETAIDVESSTQTSAANLPKSISASDVTKPPLPPRPTLQEPLLVKSPTMVSMLDSLQDVSTVSHRLPDHRDPTSNIVFQKPPPPPKKPVSMCARHYAARDTQHMSAIRQPVHLSPVHHHPKNVDVQMLSSQSPHRHNTYDELAELTKTMEASTPPDEQVEIIGGISTNMMEHNETTLIEIMNKSRRVRFDVGGATATPLIARSKSNLETGNSALQPIKSSRSVMSSLSPKKAPLLVNLPSVSGNVVDRRQENGHLKSGKTTTEDISLAEIENMHRRLSFLSPTMKDEDVEEQRKRVHASTSSASISSIRNRSTVVDNDDDDENSRKSIFFRRLRDFVSNTLSPIEHELPLDVYWRQCNVNEHYIYSTAIVLGVCWGPFFIMYAIGLFFKIESSHKAIRLLLWLGYFNSALNPALIPILTRLYEV